MAEAKSSILIVDDDSEDLSALEKALDSLGCKLHTVTDPHDVLPAVYREQPDVVILDALLPGLSGFDLCKQIKTDGELKGTQVVIITGVYLRQQYRQEALQQFKADGFLTKPFRAPELQRLVVELLAKKTRKPPSSFLSRLGLPSKTPSPKKRGLLGRLFGKEEEPAPARIAPVPRARTGELPKSRSGKVPSPESAPAPDVANEAKTSETMPDTAAPAATATAAHRNETEIAAAVEAPTEVPEVPDVEKDTEDTDAVVPTEPVTTDEPATVAAVDDKNESTEEKASEPKVQEPVEKAAATDDDAAPEPEAAEAEPSVSDEPAADVPATPAAAAAATKDEKAEDGREPDKPDNAEPVDDTPESEEAGDVDVSASVASTATQAVQGLDATPVADEEDDVEWKTEQPAPRPPEPEPKAEETDAEPAVTERAEADADPSQVEKPEPDAAASSPLAVQRPRFRVGDVPIYDEEDFYSELKRELSKCRRVDRPLTLILIQVDDLTQIVELFGKEIREAVLWHVAEQAMAALREVDLVGMMSSKDLIALTAFASDKYGGGRVVARMRKLLEKNPFRVGEELPPIVPALQFGMSSYPEDGDEVAGLIAKASEDIEH